MTERALERRDRQERTENRIGNHIAGVIVNGGLLWVMTALPGWGLPYLLPAYSSALPAITLSLTVQIALSGMLIFYRPRFLFHLARVVAGGFTAFALSALLRFFPVDFSPIAGAGAALNLATRIVFIVGMAGSIISAVVHGIKFLGLVFRGQVDR